MTNNDAAEEERVMENQLCGGGRWCGGRGGRQLILAGCLAMGFIAAIGCRSKPSSKQPAKLSADEVLVKMLDAYSSAENYRDNGTIFLRYKEGSSPHIDSAPLSVSYARPNRIRVRAYQTALACDGEWFLATIKDTATANMDNQFLKRPAPQSLSIEALMDDQILAQLIQSGLGRQPIQLELLLGDHPLQLFLGEQAERTLADDAKIDRHTCHRVDVVTEEGKFRFWIDNETFLLYRLEYPTDKIEEELSQMASSIGDVSLVAEFSRATFAASENTSFKIKSPAKAKVVRRFVAPPQPLPTNLFGQRIEGFEFTDAVSGERVDDEQMLGRTQVMIWFNDHPAGKASLQLLEQVKTAFEGDAVDFYGVAVEPPEVGTAEIAERLRAWDVDVPLLRDTKAVGRDLFQVQLLPTVIAIDGDNVLHVFDESHNPRLAAELPKVLELLAQGENIAADILQGAENEQLVYQRSLIAAGLDPKEASPAATKPTFPKRTRPFHLSLEEAWSTTDITAPGNLLQLDGESQRVLVHEGFRSIAVLGPDGSVQSRHSLDLPEGQSVSFARHYRSAAGVDHFLVADILGKQVHVFDGDWKRVLSYPPLSQQHEGIRDAVICDLEQNGKVGVYIGFWNLIGVQGVSLDGERQWSNRVCSAVQSVALSTPNALGWRKLLATGDTGAIHQINHFGNHDPPRRVGEFLVDLLFVAKSPERQGAVYCGVAFAQARQRVAVGLDAKFQEVWSYDIPGGEFQSHLQFATTGNLRGAEGEHEWIFAGPDGSIHVVSGDGKFNDFFFTGTSISGVAAIDSADGPQLWIATPDAVTAWKVTLGE